MPVLNRENYQALASGHIHTPVSEKLRKVLEYLGNESRFPGDIVSVHRTPTRCSTLLNQGTWCSCWKPYLSDATFDERKITALFIRAGW